MIKLLLLIPTLDRSGAEKQLTLLATRLPRDEFVVHVAALTRGGPLAEDLRAAGVRLTILGKHFKFDPIALHRLRRLVAAEQPDILHTWLFAANAYGRMVGGARPPFPIVVSERCVDSWKSGWQMWLDRRLIPRTAGLVGNSASVAEFYRQQGFPAERLSVIANGMDLPELSADARQIAREKLGVPADCRVIGYVGRLARQKRVRDLIWAFELVRVMQGNVQFVIVGDGPDRDALRAFAENLKIGDRVRFVGHRGDAASLIPAFDVFWLASDFEGLSNSIMEAMAARVPVVASDIPPNRELVVPGETGFLAPAGDCVAFAQFAEKLLLDRELSARLGAAGRERIGREFSTARMVDAYAELYREVLRRPGVSEPTAIRYRSELIGH